MLFKEEELDQFIKDCEEYPAQVPTSHWGSTDVFKGLPVDMILRRIKEIPSILESG